MEIDICKNLVARIEGKELTLWHTDDFTAGTRSAPPVDLRDRSRALSGRKLQLLTKVVDLPVTSLQIVQHRVDMREFCALIMPVVAGSVKKLNFNGCGRLGVDDVALLSTALADNAAVRLMVLKLDVQDRDGMGAAIAELCRAHPTITHLSIGQLDDSLRHGGEPYALITELMRSATQLRRIELPNTPAPMRSNLRDMVPVDEAKMQSTLFAFERARYFANLHTHASDLTH
jgi:hypothetical protein